MKRKLTDLGLRLLVVICILGSMFFTSTAYAEYSDSPRQTGEAVLEELLMGTSRLIIRVGSNGCTDKNSFKIEINKEAGSSPVTHYILTIVRIVPDECKAIVDGCVMISYDLEKDLGLKGNFTYSITNRIVSSSRKQLTDESLMSIIEKYFTFSFPEIREIKPEPFEKFVMDHDYFTCYLPSRWTKERNSIGDEASGIFEVNLTLPEKAKPEEDNLYELPDPLIYVGYYRNDNIQKKNYESFLEEYQNLANKRKDSEQSDYQQPTEIVLNGMKAVEINYEVYQEEPKGLLFTVKYWLKAKFVIIKAKEGFYVLAYKSPREFFEQFAPIFEEVINSFEV